jgi:hypothetical protein
MEYGEKGFLSGFPPSALLWQQTNLNILKDHQEPHTEVANLYTIDTSGLVVGVWGFLPHGHGFNSHSVDQYVHTGRWYMAKQATVTTTFYKKI